MLTPSQIQEHVNQRIQQRTEEEIAHHTAMRERGNKILELTKLKASIERILDKHITVAIDEAVDKAEGNPAQLFAHVVIEINALAAEIWSRAPQKIQQTFTAEDFAYAMGLLCEADGHSIAGDWKLWIEIKLKREEETVEDDLDGDDAELAEIEQEVDEALAAPPTPPTTSTDVQPTVDAPVVTTSKRAKAR
jgi:hypothetical protein